MKFFFTSFSLLFLLRLSAQIPDSVQTSRLQNITVKAYEQSRKLKDLAAAVNLVGSKEFERFHTASIVQAINTGAGVRMEERSPGSYRLNIRGSSLRSPFGVRNVKVYYNDLPFTDPGGQTYLNALGYYNFHSVEILKGPGSSVYGAGTGGVMLIESLNPNEPSNVSAELAAGSFGLRSACASVTTASPSARNKFGFQYQESDGFRSHAKSDRKIVAWNGLFSPGKSVVKTTFVYSRLFYQTPGALTLVEFSADPKASRPAGGGFPGAWQNAAAIDQTVFLAGASLQQRFSEGFSNTTSAYGQYTEFDNPAVRNYGKNREPHVGARTSFRLEKPISGGSFSVNVGGELQKGFSSVGVYKNRNGEADTLQTQDDILVRQSLLFLQAAVEKRGWELTAGGSLNFLRVRFKRTYPATAALARRFSNEIAPRLSLAKKWPAVTVYTSLSKGFSPPSTSELFPSGSNINPSLRAEQGTNLDLGFRGTYGPLSFDVNAFYFRLRNTIAQQRDAGGGDFYLNAGRTLQTGIETSLTYSFLKSVSYLRPGLFWLSHTWHRFRYKEFRQLAVDYSGRLLPGVAPHTVSAGFDAKTRTGFLLSVSYYFSDRLPLNDGNTEFAKPYHLLFGKFGFETRLKERWRLRFTAAGENLLNQIYSLGNDINAFGGRYYNAASGRGISVSVGLGFFAKQQE